MSKADPTSALRKILVDLLEGAHAHADFESAIADLPANRRGEKPAGQPHTPWRLVEHLRIAQADILEYSKDARHKSPKWPDEYWPKNGAPKDEAEWERTIELYQADRAEMIALVKTADLLAPLPHAADKTVAREAVLLGDHTAYHVGQLILLRRVMGDWKD